MYKRCQADGRTVKGRRCTCGSDRRIVWAWRVDVAGPGEPRRTKGGSGLASRGEAVEAMRKAATAAESGVPEPSTLTLAQWSEQWLPAVQGKVRGGTWRGYEGAMRNHLLPRLGAVQLRRLTLAQIEAAYADLLVAVKTRHNLHLTLHRCLADAVRNDLLVKNPADGAHRLTRGSRPEMKVWDRDQLRAFLDHVAGSDLAALWRLLALSGMRRGEALGLQRDDLHLDAGFVTVRRTRSRGLAGWAIGPTKNGKARRVALDAGTCQELREHLSRQVVITMEGILFADAAGRPLDPDGVSGAFERLVRESGLPRIRLHDLRHTAATLMLAGGANPKVVSERLGHSSVQVTMDIYAHVLPGMQEEAADALAATVDAGTKVVSA